MNRTASIVIALFGLISNSLLTLQVFAAWKSLKWDSESEWEASYWQLNGLKLVWALLLFYFSSAAVVCTIGFIGVLKNKASYVRFYRDYSIADFSFCAFFTALGTYAAFLGTARAGICEEFSHHPELMRDMVEMGLTLENCERWLERAIFGVVIFAVVLMIIRLHFLLAVSNHYSNLVSSHQHHYHHRVTSNSKSAPSAYHTHTMHRIFVVPQVHTPSDPELGSDVELVYAPIPRHILPKHIQDQMAEVWISDPTPSTSALSPRNLERRQHHHHHHRRQRRSTSRSSHSNDRQTGRIRLDIEEDEPLLNPYAEDRKA